MANDVTCREIQRKDGQWMRAKSFDTFCPLGPWIETEFVPGNQRITTTLNGVIKQDAHLSDMMFKVPDIIHFITQVMTLLPGDIVITGTPAGIGPMPEKATVAVAIEGLGQLTNKVSAQP
jgi:2-keto-4-pentenoate hydratase/2-oxohepta-3-ene-1,7-dioic acid hydratase in catechol pathway